LDLIQLHAIGDIAELDKATGSGGALEAAIKAKDEGLVGAIGITGHGHEAPATHLEALRRFDFDTVLTPINYTLSKREDYYRDFLTLAEEIRRKDLGSSRSSPGRCATGRPRNIRTRPGTSRSLSRSGSPLRWRGCSRTRPSPASDGQ